MLRTVWAQASRVVRPACADDAHDLGGVVQVDEVELEVLARGDVAAVEAGVLLGDLGQGVHLVRGHAAVGQLDAHHLVVFLALAVDAAREAEELEGRLALRRRCGTSWRAPRTRRSRRSRLGRMKPGLISGPCVLHVRSYPGF